MKKCSYCKKQISNSSTKCRYCGKKLEKNQLKKTAGDTAFLGIEKTNRVNNIFNVFLSLMFSFILASSLVYLVIRPIYRIMNPDNEYQKTEENHSYSSGIQRSKEIEKLTPQKIYRHTTTTDKISEADRDNITERQQSDDCTENPQSCKVMQEIIDQFYTPKEQ